MEIGIRAELGSAGMLMLVLAAGPQGRCRKRGKRASEGRSIHSRSLSATSICCRFVPAMCRFLRAGVDSCAFFPVRPFVASVRLQTGGVV